MYGDDDVRAESWDIMEKAMTIFLTACEQGAMVRLNKLNLSANRAHAPPTHRLADCFSGGQLRSLTSITLRIELLEEAPASELRALIAAMAVGCPLLQNFNLGFHYQYLEVGTLQQMQIAVFENSWPSLRILPQEFLEAPSGVDFVAFRKNMKESFTPGHLRFPSFTELIIGESKTVSYARSAFAYFPETLAQFTKLQPTGRALRNPLLNSEKSMKGLLPCLESLDVSSLMLGLPEKFDSSFFFLADVAQEEADHIEYVREFKANTYRCMSALASISSCVLKSFTFGEMLITNFKREIRRLFFEATSMLCGVEKLVIRSSQLELPYSFFDLDEWSSGSIYLADQREIYEVDENFETEVNRKEMKDAAFLRLLINRNVGNFCDDVKTINFRSHGVLGSDYFHDRAISAIIKLYKESCCGGEKKEEESDEEGDEDEGFEDEDEKWNDEEEAAKNLAIASVFERFAFSAQDLEDALYDDYVPTLLVIALIDTGYCNELRVLVQNGEDWARALCNCERLEVIETTDMELIKALFTLTPPRLAVVVSKALSSYSLNVLKTGLNKLPRPIFDVFQPLLPRANDLGVDKDSRLSSISAPSLLVLIFEPERGPSLLLCSRQTARIDLRHEATRNTFGLENLLFELE